MTWKAWREKISKRHDFGELDCPDFWVQLKSLDALSWGEAKKYQALDLTVAEQAVEAEKILRWAVVDWNLTDPEDEAVSLPLPSQDGASLEKLPSQFIAQMHLWLVADSKLAAGGATEGVPQPSETSSGQT